MIKPEQIPHESAKAVYDLFDLGYLESIGLHPDNIVVAAINAWPGVTSTAGISAADRFGKYHSVEPMTLHLPLPREKNND